MQYFGEKRVGSEIRWRKMFSAAFRDHIFDFPGHFPRRIKNRDRVTSAFIDHGHGRHIRDPIPHIDDIPEWDPPIFLGHVLIDAFANI